MARPDNLPKWAYIRQESYETNYDDKQYQSESSIYGYNMRQQADEEGEEAQRYYNYKEIRRQKEKKVDSGNEYAYSLNFDNDEY